MYLSCSLALLVAYVASAATLDSSQLLRREQYEDPASIPGDKVDSALLELGTEEREEEVSYEDDLHVLEDIVARGTELDDQVTILKEIVAHREAARQSSDVSSEQASLLQTEEEDQALSDSVSQTEANIKELSALLDQFDQLHQGEPDADDADDAADSTAATETDDDASDGEEGDADESSDATESGEADETSEASELDDGADPEGKDETSDATESGEDSGASTDASEDSSTDASEDSSTDASTGVSGDAELDASTDAS